MKFIEKFPSVSIGIPTYNQKSFIAKAIQSALNQDYPNLEVIVSDDNSTDDTYKEVKPFFSDPRLRYFKNETNLGRVGNYKKILYDYANGDCYLNLDADDFLTDRSFIATAVHTMQQEPELVLFQAAYYVQQLNGTLLVRKYDIAKTLQVMDGKEFFLSYPNRTGVFHLAAVYNRAKAMEIDFYRSVALRTDSESLLRLALRGKVAVYNKPVAVWNDTGENETWSLNSKILVQEKAVFEAVAADAYNFLPAEVVNSWKKKVRQNVDLYFIDSSLRRQPFHKAVFKLLRFARPNLTFLKVFLKHLLRGVHFH